MTRGERICSFIEYYCLIPEGAQVGQPIKLMKFQRKFILDVFDNPHGNSRAYLSVARKNSKFNKSRSYSKTDGLVALAMALGSTSAEDMTMPTSPWDDPEFKMAV